jgi:PAS domain S-box-containing protein/putative nucleotidyltransferase with HDIG domain
VTRAPAKRPSPRRATSDVQLAEITAQRLRAEAAEDLLRDVRRRDADARAGQAPGGGVIGHGADPTDLQHLQSERDMYAQLVESAPDAIITENLKGEITSWNRTAQTIFGYSRAEALGRTAGLIAPVGQARDTTDLAARALSGERIEGLDAQRLAKGGRLVSISLTILPILNADGALVGLSRIYSDRTERHRLERDRTLQSALRLAIQESSIDGILLVDPKGRIISHNRRFLELWNIPPEHLEEGADSAVLEGVADQTQDPGAFLARVHELYRNHAATAREELTLKDGRTVERYTAPVTLEGGEFAGRVWFFRDISERKLAEEKISESEIRFRSIVEQDIAGIMIIGADGVLTYANRALANMLDHTPDELIGQTFTQFVVPDQREALVTRLAKRIAGERVPMRFETTLLRKDGLCMEMMAQTALATLEGKPVSIGVLLDITGRKQAEASLRRLNRTLVTLNYGNAALVRARSEAELMQAMCRTLVEQGGYKLAWIGLPQHDRGKSIRPTAWAGDKRYMDGLEVSWGTKTRGQGVSGRALRLGRPQISANLADDRRMAPWSARAREHGFGASAAFPLLNEAKAFGVLSLYAAEIDAFNDDETRLLAELSNDLAYGILALRARAERETAVAHLQESLEATVGALANTTEVRDPYTSGHQYRVARLATAIAEELHLSKDVIQGIKLAGAIHDIGKISVPSELLTKPGKLSTLEFQLIKTHAQAGYEIVKDVRFPWPIAQTILQHHERLDGSGYPNGLKGDQILTEARVLAVADVVEAMCAMRPYRAALGIEAALAEIEQGRGRIYDPKVVGACLRLFREKGYDWA